MKVATRKKLEIALRSPHKPEIADYLEDSRSSATDFTQEIENLVAATETLLARRGMAKDDASEGASNVLEEFSIRLAGFWADCLFATETPPGIESPLSMHEWLNQEQGG